MTEAEKHKEKIISLMRRVNDLRFDIQLVAVEISDEDLFEAAELLTPLLPALGSKLG